MFYAGRLKPFLNPRRTESAQPGDHRKISYIQLTPGELIDQLDNSNPTHLPCSSAVLLFASNFTGITAGSLYLAQLQGAAEQFFEMFFSMLSQGWKFTRGCEMFFFSHRQLEILAERDEFASRQTFTGAAEHTASHVDYLAPGINRLLGTGGRAFGCQFG